jgi:endonuclease YncB( thermonuclease family)
MLTLAALLTVPAATSAQRDDKLQIPEDAEPARYVEIIDGDTIVVELENVQGDYSEYTARLIGIDAPENSITYGNDPESYGREASSKSNSLLVTAEDGIVWLEADVDDEAPN